MSEKSVKPAWTSDDMKAAITKAYKALKGSSVTLTDHNVGVRAAMYTHATAPVLERYLNALTLKQKIDLGYPDPTAVKSTATKSAPERGLTARWRSNGPATFRRG